MPTALLSNPSDWCIVSCQQPKLHRTASPCSIPGWRVQHRKCVARAAKRSQVAKPQIDSSDRESKAKAVAAAVTIQTAEGRSGEELQERELECVANGDSVSCFVDDEKPGRQATAVHRAPPGQQHSNAQPQSQALGSIIATLLLVSPFAFWGTSMVAMKGLMDTLPPLVMGSFRLLPAGAILVAWAANQGRPQPSTFAAWAWITAFAVVDGAAFQGFLAEGLQTTPAGLSSVIIDSQPLSVAVLAAILFGERLNAYGVLGLGVGVLGLMLLELPEQWLFMAADKVSHGVGEAVSTGGASLGLPDALTQANGIPDFASMATDLLQGIANSASVLSGGELWMLAAAQAMAVGTVMVRYVTRHADPVMATGWHMVIGGAMLLAAALAQDNEALAHVPDLVEPNKLAAAAYVSLLGGAASYGIFFWQASTQGNLTKLSSLTFLTPVFAAAAGYVVLGEVLTPPQLLGAAVTLSSVFLINNSKGAKPREKISSKE